MHRFSITVICHLSSMNSPKSPALPAIDETYFSRLENYGFEASKLRFVQIRQIRAENRPKSRGKIWKQMKNVVPLHCQKI